MNWNSPNHVTYDCICLRRRTDLFIVYYRFRRTVSNQLTLFTLFLAWTLFTRTPKSLSWLPTFFNTMFVTRMIIYYLVLRCSTDPSLIYLWWIVLDMIHLATWELVLSMIVLYQPCSRVGEWVGELFPEMNKADFVRGDMTTLHGI